MINRQKKVENVKLDSIEFPFLVCMSSGAVTTARTVYSIDKRVNKKPRFDNQTLKIDANRKGN